MRVFVAGGTGVLGRRLVPQLVARGHQVMATTTSAAKLGLLEQLGAEGVVMDGLDAVSVGEVVATARPDAIVHQMTAISVAHAGKPDMKHMDQWFAGTNRLRTEGTDHLLAAAGATGVTNFIAQSYVAWNGIREGGWVKTEQDPVDPMTGTPAEPGMTAIGHVEDVVVRAGGAVLRYGWFYGPGATGDMVEPVRKRQFPWSGAAPATARGCIWTTRRPLPSWLWNGGRGACSTSSTTNRPRPTSGCPVWPRARERSGRCGYPPGWPGRWPGRSR
ncbi:NAD-dependent epimerase/dehydratase family protein [Streptosporangium canum]|uniref:NAD-dependent epimerase/dehydratase family protein n=1 Tax=Streptosporangium canum TaxID=324952 RepID=UPI00378C49B8